jgi:hypothetical protein
MIAATATSRTFAFTDHLPLAPYHCVFAFTISHALSARLTTIL